jgi:toxin ParE1/3/4
MLIRWSPQAADDLERIVDRIKQDHPAAARRVAEAIYLRCTDLELFPNRGRVGRIAGTRELVPAPLPYIVVYRVNPDAAKSRVYFTARGIGLEPS